MSRKFRLLNEPHQRKIYLLPLTTIKSLFNVNKTNTNFDLTIGLIITMVSK